VSTDALRRTNLATVVCDPRPQLPDGFRRNRAARARRDVLLDHEVGAVVYPDSDMIQMVTSDGEDDIVVRRESGVDAIAPWSTPRAEPDT
jgi:hypothetical protein